MYTTNTLLKDKTAENNPVEFTRRRFIKFLLVSPTFFLSLLSEDSNNQKSSLPLRASVPSQFTQDKRLVLEDDQVSKIVSLEQFLELYPGIHLEVEPQQGASFALLGVNMEAVEKFTKEFENSQGSKYRFLVKILPGEQSTAPYLIKWKSANVDDTIGITLTPSSGVKTSGPGQFRSQAAESLSFALEALMFGGGKLDEQKLGMKNVFYPTHLDHLPLFRFGFQETN